MKATRNTTSPEERFWANVQPTGFCWEWTGYKHLGYGKFHTDGVTHRAHRLAYQKLVGPIPEGLVIDHLCRNKACVNPDHLEAVSVRENTLRGFGVSAECARKTVCLKGHDITDPKNFYLTKRNIRQCRKCARARQNARRALERGQSK